MKRANTMSTITIKVKTKFTSSNAENTKWIHLTTDVKFSHGRLHCHVSGESKPRLASSATAGKEGWSLMISASSLIMSRRPCMGSGVPCPALGGGPLVAVVSWNQVGRTDLTPVKFLSPCF